MAPLRLLLLKSRKVRVSSMDMFAGMVPTRLLSRAEVKPGEILERGGVEGIELAAEPGFMEVELSNVPGAAVAGDAEPGAGRIGKRPRGQRDGCIQSGSPSEQCFCFRVDHLS